MAISKESKELIKGYIQILKDRKKEVAASINDVNKEIDNIQKRKTQLQAQITEIESSLAKLNADVADGGILL